MTIKDVWKDKTREELVPALLESKQENEILKEEIRNWMQDNGVYYEFNVNNPDHFNDYIRDFAAKIPELYKFMRKNEYLPENTLQSFTHMLELQLNKAYQEAMMGIRIL